MQDFLAANAGLWIAVAAVAGALIGFAAGRFGGVAARHARTLQAALTEERVAFDRLQGEYGEYREKVAGHFTETSERLHDLTLQYRSVYEHLAKGANELCPQGFSKLEGGLGLDALPEESEPSAEPGHDAGSDAEGEDADLEEAPAAR